MGMSHDGSLVNSKKSSDGCPRRTRLTHSMIDRVPSSGAVNVSLPRRSQLSVDSFQLSEKTLVIDHPFGYQSVVARLFLTTVSWQLVTERGLVAQLVRAHA